VQDLHKRMEKMSRADEPTKMSNFDTKKADELVRLEKMMVSFCDLDLRWLLSLPN